MNQASKSPGHIVLIPGFMCDERLFEPQTRHLGKIPHSVEIMRHEATIHEMALNILRKSPERFALAGLSMGGIIALELMRLAPERVSHLALLNSTPYEDKSLNLRKDHIRRARNGELISILKDDLKPRYLSPSTSRSILLPLIIDMGQRLGIETFTRQSIALMIRKSNLSHLNKISCPTLIMTGEDDTLCPPNINWEMARRIQDSSLKLIPNCGHLSTLEAPGIVREHLFKHWGLSQSNLLDFPVGRARLPEDV